MNQNERLFFNYLDVVTKSCRVRKSFIALWKRTSLDHAIRCSTGLDETQREEIREYANKLGFK